MLMLRVGLLRRKGLEIVSYQKWRVEPIFFYYTIPLLLYLQYTNTVPYKTCIHYNNHR